MSALLSVSLHLTEETSAKTNNHNFPWGNKNKLCSMTCGRENRKKTGDSEARWLICHCDFRMGCDPPFCITRGVPPHSEIIVGKSQSGPGSMLVVHLSL